MDPVSDGDDADDGAFEPERPGPEPPSVRDSSREDVEFADAEVDEVLLRTFWGAVISLNVALAAVPLGLLLIYFRGDWELGGLAVAIGCVAAVATLRFYRIFRADRRGGGTGP